MLAQLSIDVPTLWPSWPPLLRLILILAVVGAFLVATILGTVWMLHKKVRPKWVAILAGIRLAVLALLVLVLLQPVVSYSRQTEPLPELVVLVDASPSMGQPGAGRGTRLQEAQSLLAEGEFATALRSRFR